MSNTYTYIHTYYHCLHEAFMPQEEGSQKKRLNTKEISKCGYPVDPE